MSLYSLEALNTLALSDTGHFVYLDAWSIGAFASIFSQVMPLYFWTNNQNPLDPAQIDELEAKLAKAMGQIMHPLVGLIMPICTADLPGGTLLCDGSTYLRADYPNLYAAIDPSLQIDADSFMTPDLRDRFVLAAGPDHAAYTTGGSFEHVQSATELAAHTHTTQPHTHTEVTAVPTVVSIGLEPPVPAAVPGAGITGAAIVSVDSAGSSNPMDITPPFYALKYVVVAL